MTRIVVDPDGSRWVSVEVSADVLKKLRVDGVLDRVSEEINREFWAAVAKRIDDDIMAMVGGLDGR